MQKAACKAMALRPCLLAAAVFSATLADAEAFLRFTGAPLTRSVRNEADAAIDRACAWLAAKQSPDGSWSSGIKTTSVCLLALAGSGEELPEKERETVRKGIDWLKGTVEADTDDVSPEDAAWRDMAFAVLAPDALRKPFAEIPCPDDCTAAAACAIRERAAILGIGDAAASPKSVPRPGEDAECAWWFAHAANRNPGGEITFAPGTEPVAWRESLANAWTVSQQIDERGRGFWPGSAEDTAFAILLLKEL